MKHLASILANAGVAAGVGYQSNGTCRIKGSIPEVNFGRLGISGVLAELVEPVLAKHPELYRIGRLCLRGFFTEEGAALLAQKLPPRWKSMRLSVEACIPLAGGLYWVWIGGNADCRRTGDIVMDRLTRAFYSPGESAGPSFSTRDYKIVRYSPEGAASPLPVSCRKLSREGAAAIARLYERRMSENVTPNADPDYVFEVMYQSPETDLFVLQEACSAVPLAVVMNEYVDYPVSGFHGRSRVRVCESNDWIKDPALKKGAFLMLLRQANTCALARGVDCVEAECLPASFRAARAAGFIPRGVLERHSRIHTDIPNPEREDTAAHPDCRDFVSLFLYTLTP